MTRSFRLLAAAIFATVVLAPAAYAEEPSASTSRATDTAATAAPGAASTATPRVHASHRVDVIAPGERVDTVIDRMRALSGPAAADARTREAAGTAGAPSPERRGERGGDASRATGGMAPGSGMGPPAPGMGGVMPGSGPGPRGEAPPPDRPRRR